MDAELGNESLSRLFSTVCYWRPLCSHRNDNVMKYDEQENIVWADRSDIFVDYVWGNDRI